MQHVHKTSEPFVIPGRQPLQSKGTVVPVLRVEALRENIWAYQLLRVEDKIVHLKVHNYLYGECG